MKSIKIYIGTVLLLALSMACSSDDVAPGPNEIPETFTSQICNAVTGNTGLYWDYANAIPVPLNQTPILTNPSGQFIHSQFPALGFPLPQGYNAVEVLDQQTATIGVNVLRNDNAVVWRYVPTSTFQGGITINDVMAFEINQMFDFYGFNGNFDVQCTETKTVTHGGDITTTFGARLINFGNTTGLVWANTHFVQSLGTTFVTSSVSSGPTAEYNSLVMNTFLPLSFQLLVSGGGLLDSDLDGVPDVDDAAPFNPNIQ